MECCYHGDLAIAEWLLEQLPENQKERQLTQPNKEGFTPLMAAVKEGHLAIAKWIVNQLPEEQRVQQFKGRNKKQFNVMHQAILSGQLEMLKWIVEHLKEDWKAECEVPNTYGYTALSTLANNFKKNQRAFGPLVDYLKEKGVGMQACHRGGGRGVGGKRGRQHSGGGRR